MGQAFLTTDDDDFRTVAVDVDGVLAQYTGWKSAGGKIGPPYRWTKWLLRELSREYRVIVWSSRSSAGIHAWLTEHNLIQYVDEINTNSQILGDNPGKPVASAYIDDRAIRFTGKPGQLLADLKQQTEWWRKKKK